MGEGCQLARTLLLLILCQSLTTNSSISATSSKARANNAKGQEKSVSNLLKSEDPLNSDYCLEEDVDIREPSYNFDPSTLYDKHVRVKRDREIDSNVKSSLEKLKSDYEQEPIALASKELSKYADTIQDSDVNGDDIERYADQGDLSRMYDDLGAKDIVKRGVLLGGDYEQVDDDLAEEDTVQLQDSEDGDYIAESRVKRDDESNQDAKINSHEESRNNVIAEKESARNDEAEQDLEENSRNEKHGNLKQSVLLNDQSGLESEPDPKSLKDAKQYEAELKETRGEVGKLSNAVENPAVDMSKVVELTDSQHAASKASTSSGASKRNANFYSDYEKRAEAEIQRKIDMIKEDIKREIEQNQRIREIEENNAKFDELRNEESLEDDEPQVSRVSKVEKRQVVKRKAKRPKKPIRKKVKKKLVRRKGHKRKNLSTSKGKADKSVVKNRSARNSASNKIISKVSGPPIKKREYARQVILVEKGSNNKNRKRRSEAMKKNSEDTMGVSSMAAADEQSNEAPGVSSLVRKSDRVSLKDSNTKEESQRFAPDYNEAFGGLQSEPRASLARYKRIKRVLRVPT